MKQENESEFEAYCEGLADAEESDLIEYGIFQENSDIRAHVCPGRKTIYVFKTEEGRQAILKHKPELRNAFQPGIAARTARGWIIKPHLISDLRLLPFYSWRRWHEFNETMSTTEKGKFAVDCVVETMRQGRFPIWIDGKESDDKSIQLDGTDIVLFCEKRVQVKCDAPMKKSGNLFLQKAERNPLRNF